MIHIGEQQAVGRLVMTVDDAFAVRVGINARSPDETEITPLVRLAD
jgi:hypothetical protein